MNAYIIKTWKQKLEITDEALAKSCIPPTSKQQIGRLLLGQRPLTDEWEGRLKDAVRAIVRARRAVMDEMPQELQ
jgi:hypothetical protein